MALHLVISTNQFLEEALYLEVVVDSAASIKKEAVSRNNICSSDSYLYDCPATTGFSY